MNLDNIDDFMSICYGSAYTGRSTPTTVFAGAIGYFAFTLGMCMKNYYFENNIFDEISAV